MRSVREECTHRVLLLDTPSPSVITQAVLANLLPKRRARIGAQKVKSALSHYPGNHADERPLTSQGITHLAIAICTEPPSAPATGQTALAPPPPSARHGRRDQTLRLLRTDQLRAWSRKEIAHALGIDHYRSLCAQLSHWVKDDLLNKTSLDRYTLTPEWRSHPAPHHLQRSRICSTPPPPNDAALRLRPRS